VVGAARDGQRLRLVGRELEGSDGARFDGVPCDPREPGDRARLVRHVLDEYGAPRAIVSNAGVGWQGWVRDMTGDDVERLFAVNVVAPVELTRMLVPAMAARPGGDVVLIASVAAWVPVPPLTVYSATKAALEAYGDGPRREVWADGVRVHIIRPGPVATEFLARSIGRHPAEDEPGTRAAPGVPAGRVADAVVHCLTSRRPRRRTIPRVLAAGQLARYQPLRPLVDLAASRVSGRLVAFGRRWQWNGRRRRARRSERDPS